MTEPNEANAPLAPKPVEEMSFREAMSELDGIVAKLEGDDMELEDSLAAYERGIRLLAKLRRQLEEAQQQVDVLMGTLAPAPDDAVRDSTLS